VGVGNGPVVGVLSPFVGGDYYGAIIAGITRAVAALDGRVVAIQTLSPGSDTADAFGVPDFRHPVCWRHISAFVVIVGAVDHDYVWAVQRSGKPVVLISYDIPDVVCPAVMPDNRSGVRGAVEHLIAHGHTRIAFAGYLEVSDIRERYEGYLAALAAGGLTADPSLVFHTPDNHETGGVVAADSMIRAGLPSTAVVVGTDRNALGLSQALIAAGHDLPADQAVVGFDDITAARYVTPSLASVRQPLDVLGQTAVELLVAQARGDPVVAVRHVSTAFVPRESCGCRAGAESMYLSRDQAKEQFEDVSLLQSMLNTQYQISMDLVRAHTTDPRQLAWLRRAPARGGILGLWAHPAVDDGPMETRRPDRAPGDPGDPEVQVVSAFRRDQAGEAVTCGAIACGAVSCEAAIRLPTEGATPVSEFPPACLLELADEAAGDIVFVVPVQSPTRDWGMLAAVARIQAKTPPGRELMNESGALLAVALDQDAMVQSLRAQEEMLRRAALYDHLTGLPNRSLFLNRLEQATKRHRRQPDYRFAVLFLDLDGFKQVNDTLGHAVGDRLLVGVARRITRELRDTDTAARFGGDEFLILVDEVTDPRQPVRVVERLDVALARPFTIEGRHVTASASVGIAMSTASSDSAEDLLRDADGAMYAAKARKKRQPDHPGRPHQQGRSDPAPALTVRPTPVPGT